jgi:hypothetical protein
LARKDEDLAFELVAGRLVRDPNGRVLATEYLKSGSNRERDARAAMARVLRNPDRELSIALRFRLAALFDADHHHYETREFVIKNRKRGARPNDDMSIADDIAREVMAGEQVEAAVQLEAERYGVTHAAAYRAWKKHARLFLPNKHSFN